MKTLVKEGKYPQLYKNTMYDGEHQVLPKETIEKIIKQQDARDMMYMISDKIGFFPAGQTFGVYLTCDIDIRDGEVFPREIMPNQSSAIEDLFVTLLFTQPMYDVPEKDLFGPDDDEVTADRRTIVKALNKAGLDLSDVEDMIVMDQDSYTLNFFDVSDYIDIEEWFKYFLEPIKRISYEDALSEVIYAYYYEIADNAVDDRKIQRELDEAYADVYYYDESRNKVYPY